MCWEKMSQVVSSIAAVDDQSYLVSGGNIIFPTQTMHYNKGNP